MHFKISLVCFYLPGMHNFIIQDPLSPEREGASLSYKDPEGHIFHTYSAYARGMDMLNVAYHYRDLVPREQG